MVLVLLIPIIGFATAKPFQDTLDNRLVLQVQKTLLHPPAESRSDTIDGSPEKINKSLSNLKRTTDRLKDAETRDDVINEKLTQGRKHKAILLDYPLLSRVSHYPRVSTYEVDYNDDSEITAKDRLARDKLQKGYQESNIFYIRLPPTPYTFVPGLGYISQPPTYSTASLKPQMPLVTQLLQLPYVRPAGLRPQPAAQQSINPFIKLPIDFVSNGKPTSVYQWQKKPNKKPADSPITNLDNLSADFVSNGKPTSIYQWQANHKPVKRPDDSLNNLNMEPYTFNGKLTSLYLLGSDGSTSMHQSIRYPDYQDGYQNTYY